MSLQNKNAKVVILCGGKGTRLQEETEFRPKPLVPIGNIPILVHIMGIYSKYGYKDFVLCLGYKGDLIKEFFLHKEIVENDFTLNLKDNSKIIKHAKNKLTESDWTITFAETGAETQTGGRIKKIQKYIDGETFLATYGDGVSDINIEKLVSFHNSQKTLATLTAVHPHSKYGLIKTGNNNLIEEFVEKPRLFDYINGGFFVFNQKVFDYLNEKDDCILEREPFTNLVRDKQFSMYKHEGFWHCMDTYKDYLDLNALWDAKKTPWL